MGGDISDENARLGFIRQILSLPNARHHSNVQIGVESIDDAALVKISETESLIIASDFIRGSGFYLFEMGYLNYYDIGYFLVVANISDIAAMGGRPFGLTTVFRYHERVTDEQFKDVFYGMRDAADTFGVEIVGGDIGSYVSDVFTATAFGLVKTKNALLRKNVQDGDLLCVTGVIGRPITALTYFKKVKPLGFKLSQEEEEKLLSSWRRPTPKVQEGILLSENSLAHACQDISDGLKATIDQLSSISGKTFSVYTERLPIDETTRKLSAYLGIDFVQVAVSASVDFELVFTISPDNEESCTKIFEEQGLQYTIIGEVNTLSKNLLIDHRGNKRELPGITWHQQSDDYLSQILNR